MKIIKGGQILTSDGLNAEVIASENIRKQNELDRIANEATRANVVEAIEVEYAPRLTGVESQLAETMTEFQQVIANATVDSEVINARGGKVNLNARLDEQSAQLAEKAQNVKNFGAKGDGITDDTIAIQTALNSFDANGGVLYFPKGVYRVPLGGLISDYPIIIEGAGAGTYESGGSRIVSESPTTVLLTANARASHFKNICFENKSVIRPTAGVGVLCKDFDFGSFDKCMFIGFWNNVQVDVGYFYNIKFCHFLRPVNYGCYMRNTAVGEHDHADQLLLGNTFSKYGDTVDGGTAIRYESGGGLRLTSNKANAGTQPGYPTTRFWDYIYHAVMQAGVTSVNPITGNSFEGFKKDGIKIELAAGATFGKIPIVGNELLSSGVASDGYFAICLDGYNGSSLNNITVNGNVAYGGCGGVKVRAARKVVVTGNNFTECGGDAINLSAALQFIQRDNMFSTKMVDSDANNTSSQYADHAREKWSYRKNIFQLATSATYGKIIPGEYSAGILKVAVAGNVTGVGAVRLERVRAITLLKAIDAYPVATTIGTDISVGIAAAEIAISFDTATIATVKPKVTSVNGKTFTGSIIVEYEGNVTTFSYAD